MLRKCVIALASAMLAGLVAGCRESEAPPPVAAGKAKTTTTICLLAGQKGLPYFTCAADGALEAVENAKGVLLKYDGPEDGSPTKAAAMIAKWAQEGADVIAASPDGSKAVADAMRNARKHGVRVIAWGTDAEAEARDFFVSPAGADKIASALVEAFVKNLGADPNGDVGIITTTMEDPRRDAWVEAAKARLNQAGLNVVGVKPCNDNRGLAGQAAKALLKSHPNLRGIIALSPAGLAGAGEAIRQAGKARKVPVNGLATPIEARTYILDGTARSVIFWNPKDLGYLTIKVAIALAKGKLESGAKTLEAGRLGKRTVAGDTVLLGEVLIFNKDNIDKFDF